MLKQMHLQVQFLPGHLPVFLLFRLMLSELRDVFYSTILLFYCTQRLREFLSVQTQLLKLLWIRTKAAKNWLHTQV